MRASHSWVLLGARLCLSCSFNINKGRGFAGNSGNSALQLEHVGGGGKAEPRGFGLLVPYVSSVEASRSK